MYVYVCMYVYQTSGSESQQMKVELTHVHLKM